MLTPLINATELIWCLCFHTVCSNNCWDVMWTVIQWNWCAMLAVKRYAKMVISVVEVIGATTVLISSVHLYLAW